MTNRTHENETQRGQVLATFGEARIVRVNGNLELRGGSMAERMEAVEWICLFMPQEIPKLQLVA